MTPELTPRERKATLLASADIQGWIKDHRSASTAKLQLEQLELFCRRTGLDPDQLVKLASEKPNRAFRVRVLDWIAVERKAGRPDQYIKTIWYGVKSWLRFNEVGFEWSPALDVQPAATLDAERVPTAEELRRLLSVLSPRDRAAVLILASSGVRIGVLASRFEAAGLALKSFPDLLLSGGVPRFSEVPPALHVPTKLSKTRKDYYTFITAEAGEALVAYLQERKRRGERLAPESSVIAPEPRASRAHFRRGREDSLFISGKSLGNVIRLGLRKVMPRDVRVRPHTLRAWTSSQLELAERHGKVTRSVREYFLGHNLKSVELRYNLGKKLSPASLEELRQVYARCEPFLSTMPSKSDQETQSRMAKIMLMGLGYSEEELAKVDFENLDVQVFQDLVNKKVASSAPRSKQQVVDSNELPQFLEKSWTVVAAVNDHQVVLNPPGSR